MRDRILGFFRREYCTGVTFAEMVGFFGDDIKGDWGWSVGHNAVLWVDLSKEFLDAMKLLVDEGFLTITPTSIFTYVNDGSILRYPVAKGNYRYKKLHWLPVCFSLTNTDGLEEEGEVT